MVFCVASVYSRGFLWLDGVIRLLGPGQWNRNIITWMKSEWNSWKHTYNIHALSSSASYMERMEDSRTEQSHRCRQPGSLNNPEELCSPRNWSVPYYAIVVQWLLKCRSALQGWADLTTAAVAAPVWFLRVSVPRLCFPWILPTRTSRVLRTLIQPIPVKHGILSVMPWLWIGPLDEGCLSVLTARMPPPVQICFLDSLRHKC